MKVYIQARLSTKEEKVERFSDGHLKVSVKDQCKEERNANKEPCGEDAV